MLTLGIMKSHYGEQQSNVVIIDAGYSNF